MKLIEALAVLRRPAPPEMEAFQVSLCTGFTPLHLQTFLAAHLRVSLRDRAVEIVTGLFGELARTVEQAATASSCAALAVIVEWSDLDPRLGVRRLGGWSPQAIDDVLENCGHSLAQLGSYLRSAVENKPVALALPTLPLPMVAFTPGWEESRIRLELDLLLNSFAADLVKLPLLRLVSRQALEQRSPLELRFDIQSELQSGYPYKNAHADVLAEMLARLLAPPAPRKGLITDLDNTLWAGILGEDGVDGVSWTLDQHAQVHGLYQQLLDSLAETGVLIAVATKNEPATVQQALDRSDLLLRKDHLFPVAAGWGAKSDAIREILQRWNIGQDAVAFVDDSPLELAEVKAAFPEIECLQFSGSDPAAVWRLLANLRDIFGKHQLSADDSIRAQSLKNASEFSMGQHALGSPDAFLESIDPFLEFSFKSDPPDPRALELLNKTNQFNLNGYRFTEADWQSYLQQPGTFVMVASYRDKFGPLGKVAVATGRYHDGTVRLERWVMSCRAFSRRIEHCSLRKLFEKFGAREIEFDFAATPKNAPLQQFFQEMTGEELRPGHRLGFEHFLERCPNLVHRVEEI